jgi:hypothetical protein
MNDNFSFERFKKSTSIGLEKIYNEIAIMARNKLITHDFANKKMEELYNYGIESGKFSRDDNISYLKRRNCRKNGKKRTHLEFALNLRKGQKDEEEVFLYFVKFMKKIHPDKKIIWELYGSDHKGYVMIVNFHNRKKIHVSSPDYKMKIGNETSLVEVKSFNDPPTFKICNLKEYKRCESYIVFRHIKTYYLCNPEGVKEILEMKKGYRWDQDVIKLSKIDLKWFLDEKYFKTFRND